MTRAHEIGQIVPAQTPPAEFADRVVAAALRERGERGERGERESREGAHRGVRRAAFFAVAATLLLGGAAWGFSLWARPVAVRPMTVPSAIVTAPPHERPERTAAPAEFDAGSERDAGMRVPAQPVLHRLKTVTAAEAKVDAGAKVIVPPCECGRDEVICACF